MVQRGSLKMFPGRTPKEVQSLVDELQLTLGAINTKEEVARASIFNAELRFAVSKEDRLREQAWEIHLNKNCHRGRAWAEIMLYRSTGECSAFFVPTGENGTYLETSSVDELDVCAVAFLRLLGSIAPKKCLNQDLDNYLFLL